MDNTYAAQRRISLLENVFSSRIIRPEGRIPNNGFPGDALGHCQCITIHIVCPACRNTLEIDPDMEGREVQCGACLEQFVAEPAGRERVRSATGDRSDSSDDEDERRSPRSVSRRRDEDDDDVERRPSRRSRRVRDAEQKSRLTYILLGIFLGTWGVHNFYAGRTEPGIAQLVITLISIPLMFVFCIGLFTIWIPSVWAIVEIIVVDRDGNNVPMDQ